jgi:hypothetical protein
MKAMTKKEDELLAQIGRLIDWYLAFKPSVTRLEVFPDDFKRLGKMAGRAGIAITETGFTYRGFNISQIGVDAQPETPV